MSNHGPRYELRDLWLRLLTSTPTHNQTCLQVHCSTATCSIFPDCNSSMISALSGTARSCVRVEDAALVKHTATKTMYPERRLQQCILHIQTDSTAANGNEAGMWTTHATGTQTKCGQIIPGASRNPNSYQNTAAALQQACHKRATFREATWMGSALPQCQERPPRPWEMRENCIALSSEHACWRPSL